MKILKMIAHFTVIALIAFYAISFYVMVNEGFNTAKIYNYIDEDTGCHYLYAPSGALTPRLDATGRQVGCEYPARSKS